MDSELKEAISALSKPPDERTLFDLKKISEAIQPLKFFKTMSDSITRSLFDECCLLLRYEFKPANSYIIHYGDKATRFFIILKGKVGIKVPSPGTGKLKFKEVLEMSDGSSFGELGLNENKKRAASVICKEPTHFMYLKKQNYLDLFVHHILSKQRAIIQTLKMNYIFTAFSNIFILKLSYFFNQETYNRGSYIYKEKQPVDKIYIIRDGEFRITKKIKFNGKRIGILNNKTRRENTEITILSSGSFCNEEDILNDEHAYSCKCISTTGIVYSIQKVDFVNKILSRETEQTMKILELKQGIRKKQVGNIVNTRNNYNINPRRSRRQIPTIKTPKTKLSPRARLSPVNKKKPLLGKITSSKTRQLLKLYKTNDDRLTISMENSPSKSTVYNWLIINKMPVSP